MKKSRKKEWLRPDGRYEAQGLDSYQRRKSFYSRTPGEAARLAAASYAATAQDGTLYGYYVSAYLPTVQHRSLNWRSQIVWAMDGYVLPAFGHRDLRSIQRTELQRFFNSLHGSLAPSSIKRVKIIFSGILNLAEDDEMVPRNLLRRVRVPTPPRPQKRALSPEDLWKLITASHDRARPFILLTGCCGLRAGEALATNRAIAGNGSLHVARQVLQPKGGCVVSKTLKTPESFRTIPLPKELENMMLNSGQASGIWVCSDSKGGYMTPNNASRELQIAIVKAGVPRVSPHELRHTFITILEGDLECPPAIAAALAGKKYAGPNEGYVHPTQKQLRRWMEKFWKRLIESNVYDLTAFGLPSEAAVQEPTLDL